jgi:hypothetical protein
VTVRTDYLVKGCGAASMGFVDTLLMESDATVTIVDRRAAPGGHWNDAYPFVRLHQPASFYGVESRPLGDERIDAAGVNAGLMSLPSGLQVADYFHRVMAEVFLPTGRVRYLPMSELDANGEIVSLLSGRRERVEIDRKLVDGTHFQASIPLTHRRPFEVAPGATCVPPNDLPRLAPGHPHFVVVGGGKTGLDAISWLLEAGARPEAVTWVISRDAWWSNRRAVQPSAAFRTETLERFCRQFEGLASAGSVEDAALVMEQTDSWLRLDRSVMPGMYHGATVTEAELARARALGRTIRQGKVRGIEPGRIVLEGGPVEVPRNTLFVDCSASALPKTGLDRDSVFGDGRIDLHVLRFPFVGFSVALTAFIEARIEDEATRRSMGRVVPATDTVEDWMDRFVANADNQAAWSRDARIGAWMARSRLDPLGTMMRSIPAEDRTALALRGRMRELSAAVIANFRRLRGSGDRRMDEAGPGSPPAAVTSAR